jgi:IPT/TIG domain-containing protein/Big-like domain-containing protein
VTLSPGRGQATFTPAQAITDRHGEANFSVVDARVETVSFLVNDVSDNVALTTVPQVTFTSGGPSSSVSTIAAAPATVPADGTTTSTLNVTILDPSGNPLTGKTISLSQGGGSSTISAPSGATNSNGVTTFTVTDASPETVTYSARDVTDGFDLTRTATVTFTGKPTSSASTIAADPASVPANGLTASTVTVTLKDQNGNAVSGKTVTLKQDGVSRINPLAPGSDVSDQKGMAVFAVTDDTSQKVTYTATDGTDHISLTGSTAVTFTGPPSGANSTVVANPTNLPADGVSASTVIVTLLDGIGQAIPGHNITLTPTSGSHSSVTLASPGSNTTNGSGVAAFTVTDLFGETVTYSAADTSVSPAQKLFATATVTFAPTPAVSSVSPNYGPPGGGTKVTISGPNLAGATGVKFGDTLVNVSFNKKTGTVSATSPSGTGTVPVVVITATGPTPAAPAAQFRYGPAVTGVSPTSGPSSGGTKITISGNNLSGVTAVSFGGTQVTTFSRTSDTAIVLTSPAGATGTVDLRVTTPGGRSDITPSDHYTYT